MEQRIIFRIHAIQRMFERNISESDVKSVINEGKIIQAYPEDKPYPSKLVLGFVNGRPIHIVYADNRQGNERIIITVYEPEKEKWDEKFERKIK